MKKFFLTLGVACFALQSFAATRVLYRQNFENVSTPQEAGWSYGGESMGIGSDEFGKFLELKQGQTNGRSAKVTWGSDIYMKDGAPILEGDTYDVTYDFCIVQGSNNQYNTEFTVFTNHAPIDNNKYFLPWNQKAGARCWENFLIDMNQNEPAKETYQYYINNPYIETEKDVEDKDADGNVTGTHKEKEYTLNYEAANPVTFDPNTWYTVSLNVNVKTRAVEYTIETLDHTEVASGTRNVPENDVNGDPISMYAEGLFILVARYQSIIEIDNIQISFESAYDYANEPSISLSRLGKTANDELDLNLRAYTITCGIDETLHITGTDGKTLDIPYDETDGGAYVYETTTSGTLTAWTTSGTASSEKVTMEVDCNPCVLPTGVASVTSVKEGYGKSYVITVNNSDVPLRPNIFINYEFVGKSGEKISAEGETSGTKLSVEEEGTLTIVTEAFGYESAKTTVLNDVKFKEGTTWDFARMDDDQLKAAGFATFEILNSASTNGFQNWTARKRLYYNSTTETDDVINDDGTTTTVPKKILPFGFVADDNTTNVLEYSVITDNADNTKYFQGLEIFDTDRNVGVIKHVGIYNDETKNNNNIVKIKNVGANDFVLVNIINDYGNDSNHPDCATNEEYYAQLAGTDNVLVAKNIVVEPGNIPNYKGSKERNFGSYSLLNEDGTYDVCCALYRIDAALTKIVIFEAENAAVEGIASEISGDNYWYSIDGVRVAQPTRPGLYIHNGKKIIVK